LALSNVRVEVNGRKKEERRKRGRSVLTDLRSTAFEERFA